TRNSAPIKTATDFESNATANPAFDTLKQPFTSAAVLAYHDPENPCAVATDASDYVCSAILSQPDKDGHLHPVAFHSKKMSPAECNYEIYDKELLAIIQAFRVFRQYLEGAKYRIRIITDHKNLQYFMETKQLTRRQARWALLLGSFDFEIEYRPGKHISKNRGQILLG